jgi:hypothetical protein
MSKQPNHRVKFVSIAHTTASELRSFAAIYSQRWARSIGKERFQMQFQQSLIVRVVLAVVTASASACTTVALVPGADRVKLTRNSPDISGCKVVGNVNGQITSGENAVFRSAAAQSSHRFGRQHYSAHYVFPHIWRGIPLRIDMAIRMPNKRIKTIRFA